MSRLQQREGNQADLGCFHELKRCSSESRDAMGAPVHRAECQRESHGRGPWRSTAPPSMQLSTEEWIYVRKLPRQEKCQRKGLKKSVSGIHTGLGTGPVPSNQSENLDHKKEYSRGFTSVIL